MIERNPMPNRDGWVFRSERGPKGRRPSNGPRLRGGASGGSPEAPPRIYRWPLVTERYLDFLARVF
jgi:hypothetical protein